MKKVLTVTQAGTYEEYDIDKFSKTVVVDPVKGLDAVTGGSISSPWKTLEYALAQVDNSGYRIVLMAGTYAPIGGTLVVSKQNLAIVAIGSGLGNTLITGIINVTSTASSVGFYNLAWNNLTVSGACNFYAIDCRSTMSVTKSGSGYFEAVNCGFDGSATNTVMGTGSCVFDGGKQGFLTVNNASAQVTVKNNISSLSMTLTAGLLDLLNSTVYATSNTTNALTSASGTTLNLSGTRFVTPSGTQARLSIAGMYAISNVSIDYTNSTFSGTAINLDNESYFNKIRVDGGGKFQWLELAYSSTFKKPFPIDTVVYNTGNLWKSNAIIPVGTTFAEGTSGATWTKLGGGGGTTFNLIKKNVEVIQNVAINPISQIDQKEYVFTNVDNINTSQYQISDLTTPNEGDIYKYVSATNNYARTLDVSTLTQSGEYEIEVTSEREKYYYDVTDKWKPIVTSLLTKFKASGEVGALFAGNYVTPLSSNERWVEQVKLSATETTGSYSAIMETGVDTISAVQDGLTGRSLYFRRNNTDNNYGFYIFTTSGYTNTLVGSLQTVVSGTIVKAQSFALFGGDYLVHVVHYGLGVNRIDIITQSWNGIDGYNAGNTFTLLASGAISFKSTLNTNNILEVQYVTSSGLFQRSVKIAGTVITAGIATLITATIPYYYDVVSSFSGGKYLSLQQTTAGSDTVTYNAYDVDNTTFVRTAIVGLSGTITGFTDVDTANLKGIGKSGEVLMYWRGTLGTFSKFFNLSSALHYSVGQISSVSLDVKLTFGTDTTVGCSLGKFPNSERPSVCGWVRSGDSVSIDEPSTITGTRININVALDYGIVWTGSKFFSAYSGQVGGGIIPSASPTNVEMTLTKVTKNADVIPDCIIQKSGVYGELIEVAGDGDISKGHTGIVAGQIYYLVGGRITTIDNGIQIGVGISDTEIKCFLDFNNNNERINNLLASVASLSSLTSLHTTQIATNTAKITSLENASVVKLPSITQGFGSAYIVSHETLGDYIYAGGSRTVSRLYGYLSNTDNSVVKIGRNDSEKTVNKKVTYKDGYPKMSIRNSLAVTTDGRLYIGGAANGAGQWGDGTTTWLDSRQGKMILATNDLIFGATKQVKDAWLGTLPWSNDTIRDTFYVSVYDTSTQIYSLIASGYSNDGGTAWGMIAYTGTVVQSFSSVWNTVFIYANTTKVEISTFNTALIINEGVGQTGNLYVIGNNTYGQCGVGAPTNLNTFTLAQFADGTTVKNAQDIKFFYKNNGQITALLLTQDGKIWTSGYQGDYNGGLGSTTNVNKFTQITLPSIGTAKVTEIFMAFNVCYALTDNNKMFGWGYNYNNHLSNGTCSLNNGILTTVAGSIAVNTYQTTPFLMYSDVEKVWIKTHGGTSSTLVYIRTTSKRLYFLGLSGSYVGGVSDDITTQSTYANYRRESGNFNANEYVIDLKVCGMITDANEFYVRALATTNMNNLLTVGINHGLTGLDQSVPAVSVPQWTNVIIPDNLK